MKTLEKLPDEFFQDQQLVFSQMDMLQVVENDKSQFHSNNS